MKHACLLIVLTLAFTACEEEIILETDVIQLENSIQSQVLSDVPFHNVDLSDIHQTSLETFCKGGDLLEALSAFRERYQPLANRKCETVYGYISGCYEGFMTHASVFVHPECDNAQDVFVKGR